MDSAQSSGKAGPVSNVVCPGCKRSLDDVIESLIRQRGKFKGQREQMRRERDTARSEAEALAEALEAIQRLPNDDGKFELGARMQAASSLHAYRARHPKKTP